MARIDGKCVILCDFCVNGGECLEGYKTKPAYMMTPEYYAGVDPLKTGDELVTAERDRQVNELGYVIARDLAVNGNEELEQVAILLLNPAKFADRLPANWNRAYIEKLLRKPVQVRRVIAAALICAQIDVDNLKYQVLVNEQKTGNDALRGNEKG